MTLPSDKNDSINKGDLALVAESLVDLNKSLVRICNNIELVTTMMLNDTVALMEEIEFEGMSHQVIDRANTLKNTIRTSRRENKGK